MMRKKVLAIAVMAFMLLSTFVSPALAANRDLKDLDSGMTYSYDKYIENDELFNEVLDLLDDENKNMAFEWNGKFYSYADIYSVYEQDPTLSLNEIIAKLQPIGEPTEDEFKVVSVEAINASEIQVTFSEAVDRNSATDLDNYVITINNLRYGKDNAGNHYNGTANDAVSSVELSTDKKVVTIKLVNTLYLDNGDKYGVDVRDGIYSADMTKRVEKYGDTQKVFEDYDAPKLISVSLDASMYLVLNFDEPIFDDSSASYPTNEKFKVTVDGEEVKMAFPSTLLPLDYTVKSEEPLTDSLIEEGEHVVVVYNARDLVDNNGAGGNKAPILRGSYVITEDVDEEPVVKEIIPVDFNSFYVVFSEAVKNPKIIVTKGTTEFYNKTEDFTGDVILVHLPVTASTTQAGITPLYAEDAMSTDIDITVKDYKAVVSNLIGDQYSETLTLERDDLLPQALGDSYNSIKSDTDDPSNIFGYLQVVFNRDNVELNTNIDNMITVLDKDGIAREISSVDSANAGEGSNNAVNIVLKKDNSVDMTEQDLKELAPFTVRFAPGALKVNTDIVDVASDKFDHGDNKWEPGDYTNSLENIAHSTKVIDKEADEHAYKAVEAVDTVLVSNNVITIVYKEEMAASAVDINNYTLDGEALPAQTKIVMNGENKVVTITLPEETFVKDVKKKLVISKKVMTKAGSYVVGNLSTKEEYMSDLLEFIDNTKPVLEKAQFVVANTSDKTTKKIRLTFNEKVNAPSADDSDNFFDNFVVIAHDGTEIAVTAINDGTPGDEVVELEIADDINMSQTVKVKVVPESESGKPQGITDLKGNPLKEGTIVTVSGKVQ